MDNQPCEYDVSTHPPIVNFKQPLCELKKLIRMGLENHQSFYIVNHDVKPREMGKIWKETKKFVASPLHVREEIGTTLGKFIYVNLTSNK